MDEIKSVGAHMILGLFGGGRVTFCLHSAHIHVHGSHEMQRGRSELEEQFFLETLSTWVFSTITVPNLVSNSRMPPTSSSALPVASSPLLCLLESVPPPPLPCVLPHPLMIELILSTNFCYPQGSWSACRHVDRNLDGHQVLVRLCRNMSAWSEAVLSAAVLWRDCYTINILD